MIPARWHLALLSTLLLLIQVLQATSLKAESYSLDVPLVGQRFSPSDWNGDVGNNNCVIASLTMVLQYFSRGSSDAQITYSNLRSAIRTGINKHPSAGIYPQTIVENVPEFSDGMIHAKAHTALNGERAAKDLLVSELSAGRPVIVFLTRADQLDIFPEDALQPHAVVAVGYDTTTSAVTYNDPFEPRQWRTTWSKFAAAWEFSADYGSWVVAMTFEPTSISGSVYIDANSNSIKDLDEQGLGDVEVILSGNQNRTASTDVSGAYSFQVPDGHYDVRVELHDGYEATSPQVWVGVVPPEKVDFGVCGAWLTEPASVRGELLVKFKTGQSPDDITPSRLGELESALSRAGMLSYERVFEGGGDPQSANWYIVFLDECADYATAVSLIGAFEEVANIGPNLIFDVALEDEEGTTNKPVTPAPPDLVITPAPLPPTEVPTPVPAVARIWTDRPSYKDGEAGQFCYEISPAGRVVITDTDPTGVVHQVINQEHAAGGHCLDVTFRPPLGTDTLMIDLYSGSTAIAHGSATYQIVAPAPNVAPPTVCESASGFWDATEHFINPGGYVTIVGDGTQTNGGWREGEQVSFGLYDGFEDKYFLGTATVGCRNGEPYLEATFQIPSKAQPGPAASIWSEHRGITTCCMPITILSPHRPAPQSLSLSIPVGSMWTDTGIDIASGQSVTVTASGTVTVASWNTANPPTGAPGTSAAQYCTPANMPLPTLPCWSLIGRVGAGGAFYVGSSYSATPGAGRLYLGINDDVFTDNSGAWLVTITVQ